MFDSTPVREVPSYSEAEGLFEEKAHGPPPVGMEYTSNRSGPGDLIPGGEGLDISELPPVASVSPFSSQGSSSSTRSGELGITCYSCSGSGLLAVVC